MEKYQKTVILHTYHFVFNIENLLQKRLAK